MNEEAKERFQEYLTLFEEHKTEWEEIEAFTKLRDFAQTRIAEIDGDGEEEYYDEEGGDDYGDDNKDKDGDGDGEGEGDGDDY